MRSMGLFNRIVDLIRSETNYIPLNCQTKFLKTLYHSKNYMSNKMTL